MVEAQKESLQMIIWSIILFQVEKHISELATISARLSCVSLFFFELHLALFYYTHMECFLPKFLIIVFYWKAKRSFHCSCPGLFYLWMVTKALRIVHKAKNNMYDPVKGMERWMG